MAPTVAALLNQLRKMQQELTRLKIETATKAKRVRNAAAVRAKRVRNAAVARLRRARAMRAARRRAQIPRLYVNENYGRSPIMPAVHVSTQSMVSPSRSMLRTPRRPSPRTPASLHPNVKSPQFRRSPVRRASPNAPVKRTLRFSPIQESPSSPVPNYKPAGAMPTPTKMPRSILRRSN